MAANKVIQPATSAKQRSCSFTQRPFVVAAGVCILLAVYFVFSGPSEYGSSAEVELDSRINPNDASSASLVRLPGIGIARAEAIVAYRKHFRKSSAAAAFETTDDLQNVKGIGPKTVQNISQWLKFE